MENKDNIHEYLVIKQDFELILSGKKKALVDFKESFLLGKAKEGDLIILKEVDSNRKLKLKIDYVEFFRLIYDVFINIYYFTVLEGENI
jgi:hypothetical protein